MFYNLSGKTIFGKFLSNVNFHLTSFTSINFLFDYKNFNLKVLKVKITTKFLTIFSLQNNGSTELEPPVFSDSSQKGAAPLNNTDQESKPAESYNYLCTCDLYAQGRINHRCIGNFTYTSCPAWPGEGGVGPGRGGAVW